jgi:hypothetical protein
MPIPETLRDKLQTQFDLLIREGEAIHRDIEVIPGKWHEPFVRSQEPYQDPDRHVVDWPRFVAWRTRAVSLLTQVISSSAAHADTPNTFKKLQNSQSALEFAIATLKALRADFTEGVLDDIALQIESAIAGDYLAQAKDLVAGQSASVYDHVPAAVLAGAVLEKALRTVCASARPPIPTGGPDNKPFMMNRLIDELKKAGAFDEMRAKQLRWYTEIRNRAAHGEFKKVSRSDVEQLLTGVHAFLDELASKQGSVFIT